MIKNFQIRLAKMSDLTTISQFNVSLAYETEKKKLSIKLVESGVYSLLKNPVNGFYIIGDLDANPVCSLMVTKEWSDWRNGFFYWIQSVYVLPKFRRMGCYTMMHNFVRGHAKEQKAVGIRLYVEKENSGAQNVYFQQGMEKTNYCIFEEEISA